MHQVSRKLRKCAILLLLIGFLSVPGAGQTECEADHQCRLTEFCYTETGFCASCIECHTYKRLPRDTYYCATRFEECGDCVHGYKEEILSGGEIRPLCVLALTSTATPSNDKTDSSNNNAFQTVLLCLVTAMVVVVILSIYLRYWRRKSGRSPPLPDEEQHAADQAFPPPYSPLQEEVPIMPAAVSPSAPLWQPSPHGQVSHPPTCHTMADTYNELINERKDDRYVRAVPFKQPHEPYANSEEEEAGGDDDGAVGYGTPSPAALDDEETMPSSWEPGNQRRDSNVVGESPETLDDSGTSSLSLNLPVGSTTPGTDPICRRHIADESQEALSDSGTSSLSLNLPVGSTAQGTDHIYHRRHFEHIAVLTSAVPPHGNNRRRSPPSPEPQTTAKKPRCVSGASSMTSDDDDANADRGSANPPPDGATNLPNAQAPSANINTASSVGSNNINNINNVHNYVQFNVNLYADQG